MRPPHLVAVHAFFIDPQGQVLLIQRANTGYMDGWYGVPAGHVEENQFVSQSMTRELLEEVGGRPSVDTFLEPAHVMHRLKPGDERIDYFYVLSSWDGELLNNEPEKCTGLFWFSPDELPEKMIPYIRHAWEKIQIGEKFSEFLEPTA